MGLVLHGGQGTFLECPGSALSLLVGSCSTWLQGGVVCSLSLHHSVLPLSEDWLIICSGAWLLGSVEAFQ